MVPVDAQKNQWFSFLPEVILETGTHLEKEKLYPSVRHWIKELRGVEKRFKVPPPQHFTVL